MRLYNADQVEGMREDLARRGMELSRATAENIRMSKTIASLTDVAEKYRARKMYDVADDIRNAIKDANL
jgi:cysteinyl-tRNA synthetase